MTRGWRRWNDVAVRITAALGPLTATQIHSAILDACRGRGWRITVDEVAQALDGQGALTRTKDGRWEPARPTAPLLIDVALIAMVRAEESQPIPYQRMREIMVALGLNPIGSGGGPVMYYHSLAYSVSYGRWALRDHPTP